MKPGSQPLNLQKHVSINKIIHKKIPLLVKVEHNICPLNNGLCKEKLCLGTGLHANPRESTVLIFISKRSCICIIWLNKSNWMLCCVHHTSKEHNKGPKGGPFGCLLHDAVISWVFVKTQVAVQNIHCCVPIRCRFIIHFESMIFHNLEY